MYVLDFYGGDFNKSELETQLQMCSQMEIEHSGDTVTFSDICKHLRSLPSAHLALYHR